MVTLLRSTRSHLPVHDSQSQTLPADPTLPSRQAEKALVGGGGH